jgi:hypothetical protein
MQISATSFAAPIQRTITTASLEDMPTVGLSGPELVRPDGFNPSQRKLSESAQQQLSEKLGGAPVEIKSYQDVTFSSASLDIPRGNNGWAGATVMTDGYVIELESGDQGYEFRNAHGSEGGQFLQHPGDQMYVSHYEEDARGIMVPQRGEPWHIS